GGGCEGFFFEAEDGIRDWSVTGVQTCALPIFAVEEALSHFDQAAAVRLCDAKLTQLADGPLASLAAEARAALVDRDAQRIRASRSEERRVGKEGGSRWTPNHGDEKGRYVTRDE